MSDSLRDQLLKAGLVDEKKLRQTRQSGKKRRSGGKGRPGAGNTGAPPAVPEAHTQQAARSRELNREREEAARRKALAAEIRQIITDRRLSRDNGEQVYHFQHGGRIRSIHVTHEQREGLIGAQLGIVTLGGGYELVPRDAIEKVRERDANRVIVFNEPVDPPKARADEEDPYADYEIPDDLTW